MSENKKGQIAGFLQNAISLLKPNNIKESNAGLNSSAYKPFDSAKRYNEIMVGDPIPERPITGPNKPRKFQ